VGGGGGGGGVVVPGELVGGGVFLGNSLRGLIAATTQPSP